MVVFFDLDGTLTDPFEGITRSVQFALAHFGIHVADRTALAPYIGPPLRESFIERHGLSAEQADEALRQYRVRFSDVGMFENRVYDGVEALLTALKAAGVRMAVATSKPTVFSVKILEHFGLAPFFEEIVGSELNGYRVDKAEVIAEAMARLNVTSEDVWMVGDRCFDVEGARQNGVRAVGVTYGYAEDGELEAAAAAQVVNTVEELQAFLLKENEK